MGGQASAVPTPDRWGGDEWLSTPLLPSGHMISLILGDPWPRSSFSPSCHWGQTHPGNAWLPAHAAPNPEASSPPGRPGCRPAHGLTHGFPSLRKPGVKAFPQSIHCKLEGSHRKLEGWSGLVGPRRSTATP